jgi:MerR family transcriptional regulator, mercuric resistance operon regulatory protein
MAAITAARAQGLTIGRLSAHTGVNIETIRYYEKIAMLPAPPRTASGRRVYGQAEMRRLAFIRRARELGFSLDDIRALLGLAAPGKASCADVRAIAAHHLEDIRAKMTDLAKLERLLAKTIARCSGRRVPDCPVLDILDAQRSR